jgi:hypothetical protein
MSNRMRDFLMLVSITERACNVVMFFRRLSLFTTGLHCEFKNSKFTSFRPVVDANEEQMKVKW